MRIKPLSEGLGVEISDLDIRAPLTANDRSQLRQLFDEAGLICIRGQQLTADQQLQFVSQFGAISQNPDGSLYTKVSNIATDGGLDFVSECRLLRHSDLMFTPVPLDGLSLYGLEVLPGAAPTLFANAAKAWDRLPLHLAEKLAGLCAMHVTDYRPHGSYDYRPQVADFSGRPRSEFPRAIHPLRFRHPRTGHSVLGVSEHQTAQIVGLSDADSEALLAQLREILYAPDNVYAHEWRSHDLLVWDNITLQHGRPETPASAQRILRRIILSEYSQRYLEAAAMAG